MVKDDNIYPLNCIDDTGDGFSGWFAISNSRQCNDFCYWQLPAQNISYAAWNTANPHMSTVINTLFGMAYWTCAYDSADDKTMVSAAEEHGWVDSWRRYYFPPMNNPSFGDVSDILFPYLRCQKGPGELLNTWSSDVVKSAIFWECLILLASLIFHTRQYSSQHGTSTSHISANNDSLLATLMLTLSFY